jgi:NAD(P)-dependent dehydrogenase (short-subunit alcohol dehydrogenase family)
MLKAETGVEWWPVPDEAPEPPAPAAAKRRRAGAKPSRRRSGRLSGRVVLIVDGSGFGREAATAFAREGADVALVCRGEAGDADTAAAIEAEGRRCLLIVGDPGDPAFCRRAVERTGAVLGPPFMIVDELAEAGADAA